MDLPDVAYIEPAELPVTQQWSALFLLDFMGRYAVDRCGAQDGLWTALASLACVLPVWVWVASVILLVARVETYLMLAQYNVTILTLLQLMLAAIFIQSPPILGCGPARSYPNPQVTLSAYGFVVHLCHSRVSTDAISRNRRNTRCALMAIQLVFVVQSVLWIGFASPVSVISGCLVGSISACLLHEIVLIGEADPTESGCLFRLLLFIQNNLGIQTIDVLNRTIAKTGDELRSLLPPPSVEKPSSSVKQPERIPPRSVSMGYAF